MDFGGFGIMITVTKSAETQSAAIKPDAMKPLVVDLDGTLINSDVLLESFLSALVRRPWLLFLLPLWLVRGKAALKAGLAQYGDINVSLLPYNKELVDYLRQQKQSGRRLVLATASNRKFALEVEAHLGLFDDVLASDEHTNLKGGTKAEATIALLGSDDFCYAGNEAADLKVWSVCKTAIIAGPMAKSLERTVSSSCHVERIFATDAATLKTYAKACRLHQWVKNVLVFAPVIAGHKLELEWLVPALAAFFAFGLCASSVYLVNDMLDLDSDRQHPTKCNRPLASGRLPILNGLMLVPVLLIGAFAIALQLPLMFALTLAIYLVTTTAYSFVLKRIAMLDVIVLAGLYTIRIIGGAFAADIELSFWLLAFSMFVFLSLAIIKRYTELLTMKQQNKTGKARGRGYEVDDLPLLVALGGGAGYLSVLVLALYLNSPDVRHLYEHTSRLWALCPVFLLWVSRMWMTAHRGNMDDDPIVFALKDRGSQIMIVIMAAIFFVASTGMV